MRFFDLKTLDPRSKIVMMGSLSTAVMFTENLWGQAAVLFLTLLTLFLGGVKAGAVLGQLKGILALIVFLFFVQCVFTRGGGALLRIGDFVLVTEAGFHLACVLSFRFMVILLAALILLTGEPWDYLLAMVQCRLPYEIAFMVMAGIHFLPILRDEAMNVYYAVQLRGTELQKISLRGKIQVYRRICLPVLTNALRKSRSMALAMELRGLRAHPKRTYMRHLSMDIRDRCFLLAYPCIAATLIVVL